MMTNPKFYGIKRGIGSIGVSKPAAESCLPWGASLAAPGFIDAPGKEDRCLAKTAPASFYNSNRAEFQQYSVRPTRNGGKMGRTGIVQQSLKMEAIRRGLPSTRGLSVTGSQIQTEKPRPAPTNYDKRRSNPPNSSLRMMYERGDLPCVIAPGNANTLSFRVPIDQLDYSVYLPVFVSGLREEEAPLWFIAEEGVRMMLEACPSKVVPVIPQCVLPLREALNTRIKPVVVRACMAMERMAKCDVKEGQTPRCASALVPFLRQLLPVVNIYAGRNLCTMDRFDYGQRKNRVIGERIDNLLCALEEFGGPDAYPNVRYMVPTYTSSKLTA